MHHLRSSAVQERRAYAPVATEKVFAFNAAGVTNVGIYCVFAKGKKCDFQMPAEPIRIDPDTVDPELLQALGHQALKSVAELTNAVPPGYPLKVENLGPLLRLVSVAIEAGTTGSMPD